MKPRTLGGDSNDGGFTLVELLLAISIMALILVTLGFSVTEGFRNATATKISIDRSTLGNFAARYFAADMASAAYGSGAIVTTAPPACSGGTAVIDIQTSSTTAVSYAVVSDPATGNESLFRYVCSGSLTGALTPTGQQHLGTTDSTFQAQPGTCSATSCSLILSWSSPSYSITLSGTRWVDATTTTTTTAP